MKTDRVSDERVDDLRRQLRALGYLDAGVDRFVLQSAHSTRRPTTIAVLAAIRVGLIAAVLLGPAAAIGMASRLPGLITGPRDAFVVASYLGAVFGLALMAFTFVLSTLFSVTARTASVERTRWISRAAGGVVTVGCLGYLTLWWSSASLGSVWSAPLWTIAALGVAVTISLLLGHAVAITTFAVMAARRPGDGSFRNAQPGTSRPTWRLVAVAGVLAFAGATTLLLIAAPSAPAPETRPPLSVVSPGFRVKVVAIDGFDPRVFEPLRASGRAPVLTPLIAGAHSSFPVDDAGDPARAWTTAATGQPPDVHGVRGLETRRVAGVQGALASGGENRMSGALAATTDLLRLTRPSIASGVELRAKPFWEVAAEAGLRAAVVNWWATWPAVESGAHAPLVVSDRGTLRLERGGALDAEISPNDLYERLRRDWPAITQEATRIAGGPMIAGGDPPTASALRRSAELDAVQIGIAKRILADSPDLVAVYLPGLDIAQHTLLEPSATGGAAAIATRLEAIRSYYLFLDTLLSDYIRPAPDEIVVLVTQPGRRASEASGLIAIRGAAAAPGAVVTARPFDVGPTILHLLGVPISRELAGAPVAAILLPQFMTRFPVRTVATYGERRAAVPGGRGQPLDAEALERLRSLGYVR